MTTPRKADPRPTPSSPRAATPLVVDSSVVVKWFFDEPHSEEARAALDDRYDLHAPELMPLEVDNVLCKRVRRGEIPESIARDIRAALGEFPVQSHPLGPLLEPAFELALSVGASLYDCVFVALAALLGSRVVSADLRLCKAVSGTAMADYLVWIEDLVP